MITEERAMTMFVEANPVSRDDIAARMAGGTDYLATLEPRSSEVTQLDTKPDEKQPKQRPLGVWLAAAAAILILGVTIVLTTQDGEQTPPATQPSLTTIPGDALPAGEAAALEVVESAFDAYNSGDYETWHSMRSRGPFTPGNSEQQYHRAMTMAGGHYEILECLTGERQEWPELTETGSEMVFGYSVVCETSLTNAFHGAADLQLSETYRFVVEEGEVLASGGDDDEQAPWWSFTSAFDRWLRDNHPDVADVMVYVEVDGVPIFPNAASISTALEFVDEYTQTLD